MANSETVAQRWFDRVLGKTERGPLHGSNIRDVGNDVLYSYGMHFALIRALRFEDEDPKTVRTFLLNGDRYSVSTSRHQSIVRSLAHHSGVPTVIIPFSALASANIREDSIEIVEATDDRHETIKHTSHEIPSGAKWYTEDVWENVPWSAERISEELEKETAGDLASWEEEQRWADEKPDGYWSHLRRPKPEPVTELSPYTYTYDRVVVGQRRYLSLNRGIVVRVDEVDGKTTYSWTTYRHWLGESVFRAKVWTNSGFRTAYFLSGFDHQENNLYFLCELPSWSHPKSVDEAYEDLKPATVKLAEQFGRQVERQGDIFAVATLSVTTAELKAAGAAFEKRGKLLGTAHEASEVAYLGDVTYARGVLYHNPGWPRTAEHKRVRLDKSRWYFVVKNTVPVSGRVPA